MNETLRTIKERRSTRRFKSEQIKDTELQSIIEAGLYAPSAQNSQSWNFSVVQNSELLSELNDGALDIAKEVAKAYPNGPFKKMSEHGNFNIFYKAPTVIFVSGKDDTIAPKADCSAAMQNMTLAAESLEVGSCWNGMVQALLNGEMSEKYRAKINIPKGYTIQFALLLGYKDGESVKAATRKENTVQYFR